MCIEQIGQITGLPLIWGAGIAMSIGGIELCTDNNLHFLNITMQNGGWTDMFSGGKTIFVIKICEHAFFVEGLVQGEYFS